MGKIRVAIVGVGNCASSFVQGIYKYREAPEDEFIPGIMHPVLGDYHIGDIEVVAAFDVDASKVGKDVSEAINMDISTISRVVNSKYIETPYGIKSLKYYFSESISKSELSNFLKIIQISPCLVLLTFLSSRTFSLMHDCGHGSLFRTHWLNRLVGFF